MASHNHVKSGLRPFRPHSHTSKTLQPASISSALVLMSRSMVWRNFSAQNSGRVAGEVANRQPSWRCQKQPCTKTHVLYCASTMSGHPGRTRTWIRNLKPWACRNFRTFSSGLVFLLAILDIMRERVSELTTSISTPCFIGVKLEVKPS